MSAPAFTPGPWVVDASGLIEIVAPEVFRGPHGDPSVIAEVCEDGDDAATTLADARLIAAAPDLYAALEKIAAHLADACDGGVLDRKPEAKLWNLARTALEKAVGP